MFNTGLSQSVAGSLTAWEFNFLWEEADSWCQMGTFVTGCPRQGLQLLGPGVCHQGIQELRLHTAVPADCWRGLQTCDCKSPSFDGKEVEGRIWSHLEWAGLQIQYFWTAKGHTYWSVHKEAPLSLSLPSWIHIRSLDHRNTLFAHPQGWELLGIGNLDLSFLLTSWGNEARFCFEVRHSARRSEQGWCWICLAKASYIQVVCQTKLTPRECSRNRAIPPFQALMMIFAVWVFFGTYR